MLHFTIRDLLWLTVVVALAVGWACSTAASKPYLNDWTILPRGSVGRW
jgi:hypothetical protein